MDSPNVPRTRAALEALIEGKIEESVHLEYKSSGALNPANRAKTRDDLTKDISSIANAAGGILIYGVKEFSDTDRKHLPEKLTPIDRRQFSREWIDQVAGNIEPRVEGLEIIPIPVGPDEWDVCYVLVVPQSGTAHQATDHIYYRRRNFVADPMADYEVRETMRRRKNPVVAVQMRIRPQHYEQRARILFRLTNESHVIARYFAIVVDFPWEFSGRRVGFPQGMATLDTDKTAGTTCYHFSISGAAGAPLFPGSGQTLEREFFHGIGLEGVLLPSIPVARVVVYADEMHPLRVEKDPVRALEDWT